MCSPSRWAPFSDRHCKSRLLPATWARRKTARPSPATQSGRIGAGRRGRDAAPASLPRTYPFGPLRRRGGLGGAAARLVSEGPSVPLGCSPQRRFVLSAFAARQRTPQLRGRLRPRPSSRRMRLFVSGLRKTNRCISKSQQHRRPGCTGRISLRSPGAVTLSPPSFRLIGTRSPALCLLTVSARAPLHLSLPSIDVDDHDPSLRPEALRSPFSCIAHSRAARLLRAQGCGKLFPRRFAGKLFLGPAGNLDARDDAVPSPRPKTTGGARRNVGDVNREAAGASREPKG